jgi:hypothetical protein
MTAAVLVYDTAPTGHRGNYVETLARLLGGTPLIGSPLRHLARLVVAPRLLLPTYETSAYFYAALTVLRALLIRRTVIFILRPQLPAGGATRTMKIIIHRLLAALPRTELVTIFPLAPASHLYGRATYVVDLEYWDRVGMPRPEPTPLSDRAVQAAAGRRILIAPGWFSTDKGADMLLDIFEDAALATSHFLVVAGIIVGDDLAHRLAKAPADRLIFEDRLLDDDELMSLYAIGDLSWCCYAPERDISSGIFGRSIQFDVAAIVREESLLHRQADEYGRGLPVPWGDIAKARAELLAWPNGDTGRNADPTTAFNAETELRKLRTLLAIDANSGH